MTDTEFYNLGDYVMLNQEGERLVIGRIEEILQQTQRFRYISFFKPEETLSGREGYHGKNEILKSINTLEDSLENIVTKVEVFHLHDYAKLSAEDKFANNRFVCRQGYDPSEQISSPNLEPDCFCNQIINPDDDLVVCDCERIFHYQCITDEFATCPSCGYALLSASESLFKKRKLDNDKSILLKSDKDEFYDLFASALDDVVDQPEAPQQPQNPVTKGINEKRSILELKKNKSSNLTPKGGPSSTIKKGARKELGNIDNDAFQRIKNAIDNFSKVYQTKNSSGVDGLRYFTKEKYYRALLYGIEEVKEKERIAGSHLHLSEAERVIALKDTRENYKDAETLALSIEATLWFALSKNKTRIDPNYSMKTRELLGFMMDDNNYELRLSILIGERKPEDLCKASGKDLISKGMTEKLEKKEQNTLKQSLLSDEVKIIAKSHKGESVIEAAEPIEVKTHEPVKEPEPIQEEENDEETLVDLVNKIEKRTSEPPVFDDDSLESPRGNAEFGNFKLAKKPAQQRRGLDTNGDGLGDNSPLQRKNSTPKFSEETAAQISNIGNNKLIDQTLLKNVTKFFFSETHKSLSERLANHLKPDVAQSIMKNLNKHLN